MPATNHAQRGALSAGDAGELIRRARKLFRKGFLTHREAVLFDVLLWLVRKPGQDHAEASYSDLQRLGRVSRGTIAQGLRRFGQLGLLQTIKRRVRVSWGRRVASRQITNLYRFPLPATEFASPTATKDIKILYLASAADRTASLAETAAQRALEKRRRDFDAKRLRERLAT
jgi:hypothetical protein